MRKARVAPPNTIPRLELTVASMAGCMDRMLRKELQLVDSLFWTDSMAVLKYIKNEMTRFCICSDQSIEHSERYNKIFTKM